MFTSSTQDSDLHKAIKSGNFKKAERLIRAGIDLNRPGWQGQTPLHYAVKQKNASSLIKLLLEKHANLEIKALDGDKPIHYAAYNNKPDALERIIKHDQSQLLSKGRENKTAFFVAATQNNKEAMEKLIDLGADINQLDAQTGQSAMHYAIEKNDLPLLNFLISKKANIEVLNTMGLTPLQLAASMPYNSSYQAAITLINAGANVNPPKGKPPLYLLSENSNDDTPNAKSLASFLHDRGAKINEQYGENPLKLLGVISKNQLQL